MPDGEHQFINIALAGVRAPRVSTKPGEVAEPFAEDVCGTTLFYMNMQFLFMQSL